MKVVHYFVTSLTTVLLISAAHVMAAVNEGGQFSDQEMSVAKFWQGMGPALRDQGMEAYAKRYHPDFRHWDITGSGRVSDHAGAVAAWSRFDEAGHVITCTHVIPVTIDIVGDLAYARLVYEQANRMADGAMTYGAWRMFDVFKRHKDSWQVLESNMVQIEPEQEEGAQFQCLPGD
ncbi:MAG: nuclear transport factor 2 family protein [Xanthomonadales bacterium]|nr:nuclear transport factor 2 family protein [Xanthomonadales bacterium]